MPDSISSKASSSAAQSPHGSDTAKSGASRSVSGDSQRSSSNHLSGLQNAYVPTVSMCSSKSSLIMDAPVPGGKYKELGRDETFYFERPKHDRHKKEQNLTFYNARTDKTIDPKKIAADLKKQGKLKQSIAVKAAASFAINF